jgi:DNA primase
MKQYISLTEHLATRGMNYNAIKSEETITFPLWNLMGQMVGYQQYRPWADKERKENPKEMRYYTYLPSKSNTAWGVDLLDNSKKYLMLTEGIFDACKLHNAGLNALAVLANNPKPLRSWLWTLGYNVVPVCDGDAAGLKLASLSTHGLVEVLPEGLDLGDMSQEYVNERFKKYAV